MRRTTQQSLVRWVLRPVGMFVCAATLLPLTRTNKWWARIFDFPRLQISAMGVTALAAGLCARRVTDKFDRTLQGLVLGALAGQFSQMVRYTPLFRKQSLVTKNPPSDQTVSLLTANVWMENEQVPLLLELVERLQPQMILLLEPDQRWAEQLEPLRRTYPHCVLQPQDNTYGILLYSRLPLVNPEVRFLVQEDVPSIRTQVELPNGRKIWFYGVHPRPPGRLNHHDGGIRGSAPRDAELVVVAKEIQKRQEPVIVAGDFNDVAWSHTTRRFQRLGKVLDPRVGRGLYNTFHARHPFLRFPVDHLFHSEDFALVDFGREKYIGSDHLPIYATLSLEPKTAAKQETPQTEPSDEQEAREDLHEPEAKER